ncbi:FTR1 family iron permease [Anabaena sp. CCY 9402-a]|uniref:FTR1 family iron permease n=1 Tax=Anabaena sp. CCY 9402-a TaxID=3103867 RepID=UPI0039C70544
MNFSVFLPNFFVTLREGVEAALVIGIVLALLKKAKKPHLNRWVYAGVGIGIALSALIGVLLTWVTQAIGKAYPQYIEVIEPAFEGVFGVLAIAMLSWMLIWMTKQARFMKAQVEGAVTDTLTKNANVGWGIFNLILVAVVREGFETVLLISQYFQQGLIIPTISAISGLIAAVAIGVGLFVLGIKINIRQFFQVMGVLLVLIVAGLVVSALHNFDTAVLQLAHRSRASESLCFYYQHFTPNPSCILGPMVWDTSKILPDERFPGVILKSLFGYREHLYLVQAVGYMTFLLTVGGLYLRSLTDGYIKSNQNISVAPKSVKY